ncbi:hypothetical protein HBO04_20765 [Pseudomonas proteolytica]|uniref:hypothetical protein n=1 Tax=Pseudomonas proteolytica TaxID=219574 RepID=UPI0014738C83|nr:hypothetical protein [Pseudomonas proteolytica]NMZ02557.1 hypothetical protein [Pseudomonas proteolytica]
MNKHAYLEIDDLEFDDLASDLIDQGSNAFYNCHYRKVFPDTIIELTRKGLLSKRKLSKLLPKLENGKFEVLPDDSFTVDSFPSLTNDRTGQRLKLYEPTRRRDMESYRAILSHFKTYYVRMSAEEEAAVRRGQARFEELCKLGVIDEMAKALSRRISEIAGLRTPLIVIDE